MEIEINNFLSYFFPIAFTTIFSDTPVYITKICVYLIDNFYKYANINLNIDNQLVII